MGALWNFLFFLIAIGVLVTVHEAGHFYMARACGVFCERFSIGFGKVLWRFHDKKGTEYAISMIPLGGYVKMKGESDGTENTYQADSYASKSVGKRALIIAAGPLCNILLAFFLYIIVALNGTVELKAVVGEVGENSLAAQSGVVPYSQIVKVNGKDINSWSEVNLELIENLGSKMTLSFVPFTPHLAENENLKSNLPQDVLLEQLATLPKVTSYSVTLNLENLTLESEPNLLKLIGLTPLLGLSTNVVTLVQEESPAFRAGLQAQDRIVAVNGVETLNWQAVQKEISKAQGRIELYVVREGKEYRTELIPEFKCDKNNVCRNLIGVGTEFYPIDNLTLVKEYNFIEAVGKAASDTAQMSLLIARTTLMLLDGTISAQNISGPISIARGAGESASIGLIFFISFLAAVSVNLGILNLLPVPVLDGGQLLFLAYEAVVGRQPSAKVQTVLTALGISFLVSLSLFAIFNDIRAL